MIQRMPVQVVYHTVPNVVSGAGKIGTPIIVSPTDLSEDDLYILFKGKWGVHRPRPNYTRILRSNAPIKNATVIHASWDGKFYIKYQLAGITFLADIHSESLFEIMEVTGIRKGGKIPGGLVWAGMRTAKYMRLVHTDGAQCKKIIHKDDVGSNNIVRKRDLELGVLYEAFSGQRGIYLGSVNVIDFPWQYGRQIVKWIPYNSLTLWYEFSDLRMDAVEDFCGGWNIERFHVKGSHSYRKLLNKITDVDQTKLFPKIRKGALQYAMLDPNNRFNTDSKLMNLYPKGVEPEIEQGVLDFIADLGKVIIPPGTPKEELPGYLVHENQYVREEAVRYYARLTGGKWNEK